MIPLNNAVDIETYNFGAMSFDWSTNPRTHLIPFDPTFGDYNILLDGHAHTTVSDGRLTPEQLVEYSIAQGFNAVIVTDHNTVRGGLRAERYATRRYPDKIVVIPGMEYSNCRIHMNFININTTVSVGNKEFPTDEDMQRAIDRVHELGGLVIVNHIPWSNHSLERLNTPRLVNHPSVESLISWGVDGFEIVNQATFDLPTYQRLLAHNVMSLQQSNLTGSADKPPLIIMTGSDVHTPNTAFAWTVLRAKEFTKESVMDEVRNARTSFLFDPTGNRAEIMPGYSQKYLALSPLSELAEYFGSFYDRYHAQYSFHGTRCQHDVVDFHGRSIGFFVLYLVTGVLLFEAIYQTIGLVTRFAKRRLRRSVHVE
ncbi:hypothetical protein LPJ53_003816 [Coemansia erecta]|uniref:Polymerase/histidinol phosphatase N-terminal domain-containing protein n=1 Tax=Coemansia erecta TaxID=147472 RepID=A0A9W8CQF9_9FUNG|nr:hypothetical protein LPJ53_003816 [Coemansia erecta]